MLVDELVVSLKTVFDSSSARRARDEFGRFMGDVDGKARKIQERVGRISRPLAVAGGTITGLSIAAGKAIIDVAQPFERAMAEVRGWAGLTEKEIERVRDKAKEIGLENPVTHTEAAQAAVELGKAGRSGDQILEMLEPTVRMAIVGDMGMDEAAKALSDTLNIFELDFDEAGRVLDVYANTAANSTATIRQLSYAMSVTGATAKSAGVDLEDTAAAMGALISSGMRPETAATAIRNMITRLIDPTSDAAKAIREMGLNPDEIRDQLLSGEGGALFDVYEQLQGMGPELSSRIFGVEGMTGAENLAAQVENARKISESNRQSAGAAKEVMDELAKTLDGALKDLSSKWESFLQEVADTGFLDVVKDGVRLLAGLLKDITEALSNASPFWRTVAKYSIPAAIGIGAMATAVGALGIALSLASWPMILVAGKIVLIVAAVALLAAGIYLLVKNWDKVWAWIQRTLERFKEWLSTTTIGKILSNVIPVLAIIRHWDKIKEWWQGLVESVKQAIADMKAALSNSPLGRFVAKTLGIELDQEGVAAAAQDAQDKLDSVEDKDATIYERRVVASEVIDDTEAALEENRLKQEAATTDEERRVAETEEGQLRAAKAEAHRRLADTLKEEADALWDAPGMRRDARALLRESRKNRRMAAGEGFTTSARSFDRWQKRKGEAIDSWWSSLWNRKREEVVDFNAFLDDSMAEGAAAFSDETEKKGVFGTGLDVAKRTLSAFTTWVRTTWNTVWDWAAGVLDGLVTRVRTSLDTIKAFGTRIWESIGEFFQGIGTRVAGVWSNIVGGFRELVGRVKQSLVEKFAELREFLQGLPVVGRIFSLIFGDDAEAAAANDVGGIFDGIIQAFRDAVAGLKAALAETPIVGGLVNALFGDSDAAGDAAGSAIRSVFDKVVEGISDGLTAIGDVLSGAKEFVKDALRFVGIDIGSDVPDVENGGGGVVEQEVERRFHTVVRGDTLEGIAQEYGTTVEALMNLNPDIENKDEIFQGQKIALPVEAQPTVEAAQVQGASPFQEDSLSIPEAQAPVQPPLDNAGVGARVLTIGKIEVNTDVHTQPGQPVDPQPIADASLLAFSEKVEELAVRMDSGVAR